MPVELEDWAASLSKSARRTAKSLTTKALRAETKRLALVLRKYAPRRTGALRKSIRWVGANVLASDYARVQSEGGRVVPRRYAFLAVPLRADYRPGPGFITARERNGVRAVLSRNTYEVWAIRRRSVLVKGSHFMERGLEEHQRGVTDALDQSIWLGRLKELGG